MNKYSTQQLQLCKVMMNLSQSKRYSQAPSQFDDRFISQIPETRINMHAHNIEEKQFISDDVLGKRKDKIKGKIKNQFRKKIVQLASQHHFNELTKSPPLSQVRLKSKKLPSKINSEIFNIKNISVAEQKKQMPVHDFLQQQQQQQLEMSKYIMKKDFSIRSRVFNSALSPRKRMNSSLAKSRKQPATPALYSNRAKIMHGNNPEPFMEGLQPWRYAEETHFEQPIYNRIKLFK